MVAQGLNVFSLETPRKIIGKTLVEMDIRNKTGCNVIAFQVDGEQNINPDPNAQIPSNSDIILIGKSEDEQRFIEYYKSE
jgi:K+/H+ antiporter YhaU regulatory subunit KhtT